MKSQLKFLKLIFFYNKVKFYQLFKMKKYLMLRKNQNKIIKKLILRMKKINR